MKPATAGTTIIGSRKTTVSRLRPRNSFRKSRAQREAEHELDATASTVTTTVRQIACQNAPPLSASQ